MDSSDSSGDNADTDNLTCIYVGVPMLFWGRGMPFCVFKKF